MNYATHLRTNWKLAYPVILSQLGYVTMGITDNVMVGHINPTSLAAAGLALVAFNVMLIFGIGVSFAMAPLIAEAHAVDDTQKVTSVLQHGLLINFITSLALVGVATVGQRILHHMHQPEAVVALALPYLRIITYSLVPALIFQSFKQFAEGLSHTQLGMVVILGANVLNIFLNYLLIYGHGGFPAMGLTGAGWATLVARVGMAFSIAIYVYYAPRYRVYRAAFSIRRYSRKLINKILHLGIPSGVQFVFEMFAFDFSLVMMGWLGVKTQASHQIAINLAAISYMISSGLSMAATIRVGHYVGKQDMANVRMAIKSLLGMTLMIMACTALIFFTARHVLPTFYVDDAEVIATAASLLIIAGLFQFSDGTQVVCIGALRGLQDVKIPTALSFMAYWVIGLPLGYYLAFTAGYGAQGVWYGLLTGLSVTALAMYARLRWLVNR